MQKKCFIRILRFIIKFHLKENVKQNVVLSGYRSALISLMTRLESEELSLPFFQRASNLCAFQKKSSVYRGLIDWGLRK